MARRRWRIASRPWGSAAASQPSLPPQRHVCSWPESAPTAHRGARRVRVRGPRDQHAQLRRGARGARRADSPSGSCRRSPECAGDRAGDRGRRAGHVVDPASSASPSGRPPCTCTRSLFADADAKPSLRVAGSGADLQRELEDDAGRRSAARYRRPLAHGLRLGGREGRLRELAPLADDAHAAADHRVRRARSWVARARRSPALPRAAAASGRPGITVALAGGLLAAVSPAARDVVLRPVRHRLRRRGRLVSLDRLPRRPTDLGAGAWRRRPGRRRGGRWAAAVGSHAARHACVAQRTRRCGRSGCSSWPRSRSRCRSWCFTSRSSRSRRSSSTSRRATCCACSRRRTARPARRAPRSRRPRCSR